METTNVNGSSFEALLEGHRVARRAVELALEEHARTRPHPRDYDGAESHRVALEAHRLVSVALRGASSYHAANVASIRRAWRNRSA